MSACRGAAGRLGKGARTEIADHAGMAFHKRTLGSGGVEVKHGLAAGRAASVGLVAIRERKVLAVGVF